MLFGLALLGCTTLVVPRLEREPEERRLVVVVPGITGVELVQPERHRVVWGRGVNLLCPRDGGYRLAAAELLPGRAIRRIRLGPIVKPIYAPIERLFVANGWSAGDLERPSEEADLFFFEYDWRRGNGESANRLASQLENLAAVRGGEVGVSLICQSNGALICRYLAKYGTTTPEEAARGRGASLTGVRLEQLVLVGTANGGSLRVLQNLNHGRRYVPWVGRTFQPELFATFESLFQDLPIYADDLFLDSTGEPITVDLFDPETWERYGWSIYAEEAARRLGRPAAREVFPAPAERRANLAQRLDRARRLRALLDRDVDLDGLRYFSIQNDRVPTAARAVLRSSGGRWETLFFGDPAIRGRLARRLASDGDGHATVASQQWLPDSERAAFAEPTWYVDGAHFEMILEPEVLERLLQIGAAPREPSDRPPTRPETPSRPAAR